MIPNKITVLLFLIPFSTIADIRGKVVRVLDGDTIDILQNNQAYRIRLSGIDAPEKQQPFGQRSRQNLSKMIALKNVTALGDKQDRYGRLIGTIYYNNKDINAQQITSGFAWAYRYKGKASTPKYVHMESAARNASIGLWSEPNPIEPWKWRRENE